MKAYANVDNLGYVLSLSKISAPSLVEVDVPDSISCDMLGCCKVLDDGTIEFDSAKFDALPADMSPLMDELAQLSAQLAATDADVIEAVEYLFAAESLTGFLEKLVEMGSSIRETLTQRAGWRARVAEIKSALQEG